MESEKGKEGDTQTLLHTDQGRSYKMHLSINLNPLVVGGLMRKRRRSMKDEG